MITDERRAMVAPCGIDCGICELHLCKDNPQLLKMLIDKGYSEDKIPCGGCRAVEGHCPVEKELCDTYSCVTEQKLAFCSDCSDFPCVRLQPCADRANILPHNFKVFNLCTINNMGMDAFIGKSTEIKNRYYTGKMAIGKGPQLPE